MEGDIATVKLLLKRGADVNLQSELGMTALQFAEADERLEIAKLLRDARAKK